MFLKPTIAYNAAPGTVASPVPIFTHTDMDYKLSDVDRYTVNIQCRAGNSGTTVALQPQQSLDDVNWYPIGSAMANDSFASVQVTCPYFRLVLNAFSSGTDTLEVIVG